jgi:hypothetical protein
MFVKLGKFGNYWGIYQIADLLQKVGVSEDTCHKIGEVLAETKLNDLCQWIENKRKRKVKVRIDNYDVWNLDSTLSYIVLPALIKLKEQQHGAPFTEDNDVPEELRSYNAPSKENEYDTDEFHFKRWAWIMDELIWTFSQLHPDNDWESQYHSGEIDMKFNPIKFDDKGEPLLFEMVDGPKNTHVFDKEGYMKHNARINNGCRLFGVYFRGLWD